MRGCLLCIGLFVTACVLFVPVLFLPSGTEVARKHHAILVKRFTELRSRLAALKAVNAKARLRRMFVKRRLREQRDAAADRALLYNTSNATNTTNQSAHFDIRPWDMHDVTDMFDILTVSATREARHMGLDTRSQWRRQKGLPPRSELETALVGNDPLGMFSLQLVSHRTCAELPVDSGGQENATIARTLDMCAARCLLSESEPAQRKCTHFAWIPKVQICAIYPSCPAKVFHPEQVRLYSKNIIHVRELGEGLCLRHSGPLRLLEHHTCDTTEPMQTWLYDFASNAIKLQNDLSQCLDFFLQDQDFGVWPCEDAANHEFVPDHAGKLCLLEDRSKCVQNATAEHFYLQLRLPGEASCFHAGHFDGHTHMIIHRTCEPRREQWWLFELNSLSFKHSLDGSVCLNWNTEKNGFDIWKCYSTPKQQFQFDQFRLTYCLVHDPRQCLMAFETLAATGLQLRSPGDTSCIEFDGKALSRQSCRVTFLKQRWSFESSTMRFRHGQHSTLCLEFQESLNEFSALTCGPFPLQKFHYSIGTDGRKYCVGKDERKCVQEATLGPETLLRLPGGIECLQFDGMRQIVQHAPCDKSFEEQRWVFDMATQMFRYSADTTECLDYEEEEEAFAAEQCHDNHPGQQFSMHKMGIFCLNGRNDLCVQEASLAFRF